MRNPWKLTTFVLIAVLVAIVSWRGVRAVSADPQPNMKAALSHLEKAEAALKRATDDKGGHRVKAIGLVNEAIEQTKKGIAHDNKK